MKSLSQTRNQPVGVGQTNHQGYTAVKEHVGRDGQLQRRILQRPAPGHPFTRQTKINAYNFPFTYNPGSGCFFQCVYCYLRQPFFQRHISADHGREMNFLPNLPESARAFIRNHAHLPAYMKRIQMGVATELFMPNMLPYTRMREVLEVFRDEGPDWMLHLVTKSPAILQFAELLAEMRHQVQVEVSLVTMDQQASHIFEQGTPGVMQRLKIIEDLAQRGIFVRMMLMPVLREYALQPVEGVRTILFRHSVTGETRPGRKSTGRADGNFEADEVCLKLFDGKRWQQAAEPKIWKPVLVRDWSLSDQARQNWQNYGASAYKQKDLNYFHVDELIAAHQAGRSPRSERGRLEDPSAEVLVHSGESVLDDQRRILKAEVMALHRPRKEWGDPGYPPLIMRPVMDFGYNKHSIINWIDCI